MKKIKLFLLAFIFTATLALASCSVPAELEYTNEEGELVTLNVKPTEDKEEVYEAITALESVSTEEKEEFKSIRLSVKTSVLVEDDENLIDLELSSNLEMNDQFEMYANINMAAEYDINFGYGISQAGEMSVKGDVYTDSENIYFDLATKENGTKSEMKNKMALADVAGMLEGLMGSFDFDSMLPNMDSTVTSPDLGVEIPDFNFSEVGETKEEILAFIEKNNITIAKTTKSSITFKAGVAASELGLESDATLDILFGIDVNTLMPVSLEIDADAVMKALKEEEDLKKAKFNFKVELEYGDFEIKSLTDSQKKEFTDYSELIPEIPTEDVFGSLYF